jgi:hypothetical protein
MVLRKWKTNWKLCGLVAGSALLAFVVTYAFAGAGPATRATTGQSVADSTPAPQSTPDFSKPLWYVPYENAERQADKFEGERNGIRITLDQDPHSERSCTGTFQIAPPDQTLELAVRSDIGLSPQAFPRGVVPSQLPFVYLCDDEAYHIIWSFDVEPGVAGVGSGGSGMDIYRLKGTNEFHRAASDARWSEIQVAGRPGLLLSPIIVGPGAPIGGCMVAVRDQERDLLTVVSVTAGLPEFCIAIAEELS